VRVVIGKGRGGSSPPPPPPGYEVRVKPKMWINKVPTLFNHLEERVQIEQSPVEP
jgi:hypothetical protein